MLPNHEELARAMAHRTAADAGRAARDRGFRRDLEEEARTTDGGVVTNPSVTGPAMTGPAKPDRRPCPPPCPERAPGAVG